MIKTALVSLALAMGCASNPYRVNPDEMSADEHRMEAQRERKKAAEQTARYQPEASEPSPFREPSRGPEGDLETLPVYNPTEGHLRKAEWHKAHADAHERAARKLERFEDKECGNIPSKERAACPLIAQVTHIADIDQGVRVEFTEGKAIGPVLRSMRCHLAYARARGFETEASACPLYTQGIDIQKSDDGRAIEITAIVRPTIESVRHAVREQAIPAR